MNFWCNRSFMFMIDHGFDTLGKEFKFGSLLCFDICVKSLRLRYVQCGCLMTQWVEVFGGWREHLRDRRMMS